MITFLLLSFFAFIILGIPIAFALGLSSVLGIMFFMNISIAVITQRLFVSIDSFALLAIPLYMFAGFLMGEGGISKKLIDFSYSLVGRVRGGLAHVNILSSMIFAGMSGAAVADTAGVGGILIPSMVNKKYSREFSVAVTAISSTIGIIIPPSIPMVVMGGMLNISVGKLFLGGIIPGVLAGLAMMVVSYFVAKQENIEVESGKVSFKEIWSSFKSAFFAIIMPVFVVGGIIFGLVSPTEAGGIAVVYALIAGGLIYRELTLNKIWCALKETAVGSAKIYLIIGTAGLYTWLLTVNGFQRTVGNILISITDSQLLLMAIMMLIMVIITTFMEVLASLILLLPVLFPIAMQVGIDPIYFGVMIVVSVSIGLVTPPVGICLFVASELGGISILKATKSIVPYILCVVVIAIILLAVPQMVTYIPDALMSR